MTKRYTQTGRTDYGMYYVIYQSPDMVNPLITISKYPMTAKLEMEEKIVQYKKAKKQNG